MRKTIVYCDRCTEIITEDRLKDVPSIRVRYDDVNISVDDYLEVCHSCFTKFSLLYNSWANKDSK